MTHESFDSQMHKIGISLLITLFAGLAIFSHGAETRFESILDAQGHRIDDPLYDLARLLHDQEEQGIRLYRAGDYEAAYEILSNPARQGLKRAQHSMALMHIAGQSVEKNVLIGIALLGLAAESGDRKLKKEYNAAVKTLQKKYQTLVRAQTDYYIQRYGMQVQGVTCRKVKRTDSNLKVMKCLKQPGEYEDHPWAP